jgi:hypothetical protein
MSAQLGMDPMLLTIDQLTAANGLPSHATGPGNRPGTADARSVAIGLDAVEHWPNLSAMLRRKSLAILRHDGFQTWASAGGQVGSDGHPGFGDFSCTARKILSNLSAPGIRYVDGAGLSWAVWITGTCVGKLGNRNGIALGCAFDARLLSQPCRERSIRELADRMHQMAPPGGSLSEDEWRIRDRLRDRHRRLVLFNEALALVPKLYACATRLGRRRLHLQVDELATIVWGPDRLHWPDDWREAVFQALACLGRLQVEVLELPMSGWAPRPTAREPALAGLSWRNSDILSVHLGSRFLEFLGYMNVATVTPTVHQQD